MTSRFSLHRLVQLISLSIIVMLSLLGVWQVQRLRHEVAQANERVPSCLQSADVVEMFVRTSRHRITDNMYFYLPASLELSHLMKLPMLRTKWHLRCSARYTPRSIRGCRPMPPCSTVCCMRN